MLDPSVLCGLSKRVFVHHVPQVIECLVLKENIIYKIYRKLNICNIILNLNWFLHYGYIAFYVF